MTIMTAAGVEVEDADKALDRAVIHAPDPQPEGQFEVTWDPGTGFGLDGGPGRGHPGAGRTPYDQWVVHPDLPAALADVAAVPGLLGFQPGRSLVCIGHRPGHGPVVTLRYDLPGRPDIRAAAHAASHAAGVLTANRATAVTVIGYGPEDLAAGPACAAGVAAAEAGLRVTGQLRVDGDRFWCLCGEPGCAAGRPLPREAPAAGAQQPRVLASREALAAVVALDPGSGKVGRAAVAAQRAMMAKGRRRAVEDAYGIVRNLIGFYRNGGTAGPPAAATALAAVGLTPARDLAWSMMDPRWAPQHEKLWTDLTRLAPPAYRAAPATLLAFTAWQQGNGALANVALDTALAANPRYAMAHLVRGALDAGRPPAAARLPMTPEDVIASWDPQLGPQPPQAEPGGR